MCVQRCLAFAGPAAVKDGQITDAVDGHAAAATFFA